MNHTRPLAHTTDSNRLTTNLNLNGNFLLLRIRSHDRLRSLSPRFQRTIQLRSHHLHTILNTIDRNLHTDNTSRSHQHTVCCHIQNLCCRICSFLTVSITFCTCTGICNTTVTDHCLCIRMIVHNILVPFNRSSLYNVCRKSTCCYAGNFTVNHCHVCSAFIFNLSCCSCRLKTFRSCNATFNNLHKFILLYFHNFRSVPFSSTYHGHIGT